MATCRYFKIHISRKQFLYQRQPQFLNSNKGGGSDKACSCYFLLYLLNLKKTVFVTGFSDLDKRGCSNKACYQKE